MSTWKEVLCLPGLQTIYWNAAHSLVSRTPQRPTGGKEKTSSGKLILTVHNAVDLRSRDRNGFSDPYVVASVDVRGKLKRRVRSKVRSKTLSPSFEESFELETDFSTYLQLTVLDRDRLSRDDFCGTTFVELVPFADGRVHTLTAPLMPQGHIRFSIELHDDSSLFGLDLGVLCARDAQRVPLFVQHCIQSIEARDIHTMGLYRMCGRSAYVEKLRAEFTVADFATDVDLSPERDLRTAEIASVLKLYFRELPQPLLPLSLYDELVSIGHAALEAAATQSCNESETLESLKRRIHDAIGQLPQENLDTLSYLMLHLNRVRSFAEHNMMTAANLAICWTPSLLLSDAMATDSVVEGNIKARSATIELLIEHFSSIMELGEVAHLLHSEWSTDSCPPPPSTVAHTSHDPSPTASAARDDKRSLSLSSSSSLPAVDGNDDEMLLRHIYARFADENGVLSEPGFEELSRELGVQLDYVSSFEALRSALRDAQPQGHQRRATKRRVPKAKKLWDEFDSEGTGEIGSAAFKKLYEKVGGTVLCDDDFAVLMRLLDSDGNGKVSYAEFLDWYDTPHARILSLSERDITQLRTAFAQFSALDTDGDGSIDVVEFPKLHKALLFAGFSLGPISEVIRELDRDRNGVISFGEYAHYLNAKGALGLSSEVGVTLKKQGSALLNERLLEALRSNEKKD